MNKLKSNSSTIVLFRTRPALCLNKILVQILSQVDFCVQGRHLLLVVYKLFFIDLFCILTQRLEFLDLGLQALLADIALCQLRLESLVFTRQSGYFNLQFFDSLIDLRLLDGL